MDSIVKEFEACCSEESQLWRGSLAPSFVFCGVLGNAGSQVFCGENRAWLTQPASESNVVQTNCANGEILGIALPVYFTY